MYLYCLKEVWGKPGYPDHYVQVYLFLIVSFLLAFLVSISFIEPWDGNTRSMVAWSSRSSNGYSKNQSKRHYQVSYFVLWLQNIIFHDSWNFYLKNLKHGKINIWSVGYCESLIFNLRVQEQHKTRTQSTEGKHTKTKGSNSTHTPKINN